MQGIVHAGEQRVQLVLRRFFAGGRLLLLLLLPLLAAVRDGSGAETRLMLCTGGGVFSSGSNRFCVVTPGFDTAGLLLLRVTLAVDRRLSPLPSSASSISASRASTSIVMRTTTESHDVEPTDVSTKLSRCQLMAATGRRCRTQETGHRTQRS